MTEAYRRVVVLPDGISDSAAAQLGDRLAAAVQTQSELASQSPHILQFLGDLQKGPQGFYVEHEPANAILLPADLFDREAEGAAADRLMNAAAAIFHALTLAHSAQSSQSRAHGALCPGVILVDSDGIEKVTDFGFAPAICASLGSDNYLNLAVGRPSESTSEAIVTGVWEVLPPDEFEREDRICAFIDPEKYGTSILEGFEPGSDIIAAGFILHLMAEHNHPYLDLDEYPGAQCELEMSNMMDAMRYNGARRPDLRESTDEGVRLWCDLVARMLARLPRARPTAEEVSSALSKYVKPVDAGEILRRRLEALVQRVRDTQEDQVDWDHEQRAAQLIVENEAATEDVKAQAQSFLAEAGAHVLLARALELNQGDDWAEAKEPLERILALPDLSADLTEPARAAFATLEKHLAVRDELEAIESRSLPTGETDPGEAKSLAKGLLEQIKGLPPDDELPESLKARRSSLLAQIQVQFEEATSELEHLEEQRRIEAEKLARERKVDLEKAGTWLTEAQADLDAQEWDLLRTALEARPELAHWPDDAESRIASMRKRLDEHDAEERQRAAIKADRATAQRWIDQVSEAVDADQWDQAEQFLTQRPSLEHWPAEIVEQDRKLTGAVQEFQKKKADRREAQRWLDELKTAVTEESWENAAGVMARRPSLDFWPEEILERESVYRTQVEAHLEAVELVQVWLTSVRQAMDAGEWIPAIAILDSQPSVDPFPQELREQAEEFRTTATRKLEEALAELTKRRTEELQSFATALVRKLAKKPLEPFLNPELLETSLTDVVFDSLDDLREGHALLTVSVRETDATSEQQPFKTPFAFRFDGDAPKLRDDEKGLADQVSGHLRNFLTDKQKVQAAELFAPLRKGVFPDIKIHARLEKLVNKLNVRAALCGGKDKDADVETELVWAPESLTWKHADPRDFVGRALDVVTRAAQPVAESKTIQQSKQLSNYGSRLVLTLDAKGAVDANTFPESVMLEARLTFLPGNETAPVPLQTIPVTSAKVGQLSVDTSLAPAEAKLDDLVLKAQNTSRSALDNDLAGRIKSAGIKVKLLATPKRLKTPQEEVRFEFRARQGQSLTLTPRWDRDGFEFVLPNSWEKNLEEFFEAAPAGTRRKGMGIPIAVAALAAVLAGGVWFATSSGEDAGSQLVAIRDSDRDGVVDEKDECPGTRVGVQVDPRGCEIIEPPLDSDGDGVSDAKDECSGTDPGIAVDDAGCPIAETPRDADGDGVPDDSDSCPGTPAGAEVDSSGCPAPEPPADADNDGVPDAGDRCPATPTGIAVDEIGCPVPIPGAMDSGVGAIVARGILAESDRFTEEDAAGFVIETSTPDEARVYVSVAGLPKPDAPIVLTETDADGAWTLSEEQRQTIANRLEELEQLLSVKDPLSISEILPNVFDDTITPFVVRPALALSLGSAPGWRLIDSTWLALSADASVTTGTGGTEFVSLEGFELVLRAEQGRITIDDGEGALAEEIALRIGIRLLEAQAESLQAKQRELRIVLSPTEAAGASPPQIELTDPLTELRQQAELAATWPGMEPRRYQVVWNASKLAFEPADQGQFEDQANADSLAFAVLWEINSSISDDHWIRQASSGQVEELKAPDKENWTLSVTAPWHTDGPADSPERADRLPIQVGVNWLDNGETAPVLARRILNSEAIRPSYWPLVEAYANAIQGAPAFRFLLAEAPEAELAPLIQSADAKDVMRSQVIPYWRRARHVRPKIQLSEDPVDVTPSASGPAAVRLRVQGSWGLARRNGDLATNASEEALAALDEKVRQLFEPSPCLLTLSMSSEQLTRSWSDGNALLQGFADTWQQASALDDQLASYRPRARLEKKLEEQVGAAGSGVDVEASVDLDAAVAWETLQGIWSAKDVQVSAASDIASLTATLQKRLGRRSVLMRQKRASIVPTVFVEYFCGPRFTYAVVWSAEPAGGQLAEGPKLVRLCRSELLHQTGEDAAPTILGPALFDPVFSTVPAACAARDIGEHRFGQQLGVVLAPDGAMNLHDLSVMRFAALRSKLESTAPETGARTEVFQWQSLSEMVTTLKDRVCGYRLSKSLVQEADWQPLSDNAREPARWAAATLTETLGASD